jgi:hypothetical protein
MLAAAFGGDEGYSGSRFSWQAYGVHAQEVIRKIRPYMKVRTEIADEILAWEPGAKIQPRVLQAVCRGTSTAKAIAEEASVNQVYVHLRRLRDKGKIYSTKERGKPKEYHPTGFLLSEVWR